MAKGKQKYTQQGYQELLNELQRRKLVDREKIKADIAEARSFGDLSENAEYDAAREAQGKNEARIKELEALVENAEIINEEEIDANAISLGSTVKVRNETAGIEMTFDLVGSNESDPAAGKISDQSPIGAALVDKKVGDTVSIEIPGGAVKMTVLEVSRTQA